MHPPRLDFLAPGPRIGHRYQQNIPRSVYLVFAQSEFRMVVNAVYNVTLDHHSLR